MHLNAAGNWYSPGPAGGAHSAPPDLLAGLKWKGVRNPKEIEGNEETGQTGGKREREERA